jgi:hypothetical protein
VRDFFVFSAGIGEITHFLWATADKNDSGKNSGRVVTNWGLSDSMHRNKINKEATA